MKAQLDMDKIARALGAVRKGKVRSGGGYFGALELLADVRERFRVPKGGGRPTDPRWTERRLVGMSSETLRRLQDIARRISETKCIHLNAMQIAAILIEKSIPPIDEVMDLPEDLLDSFQRRKAVGNSR